ncbi:UNVERIFIED_CONTAM: hypothetical protein GTU68_033192 [Idotea baltica]|nr:hypothetical protein [Idotea baltica]
MSKANDPQRRSWVPVPEGSDFPIQNLPFGVFTKGDDHKHIGVAIGEHILDITVLSRGSDVLSDLGIPSSIFGVGILNPLLALGRQKVSELRDAISDLLEEGNPQLRDDADVRKRVLVAQSEVKMTLPVKVGDYTDFYSSIEHATNVGTMFRDPNNALLPNWRHLPVGYHGRASSIVVSGTETRRPKGQTKADGEDPKYGPTRLLDFELEMAFVIGKGNDLGNPIAISDAENHIAGMLLFNDWSARDIQKWEYVPLGPFLGKSFSSTASPWLVTLDALEPFRVQGPTQEPAVLDYLAPDGPQNYNIELEVYIQPEGQAPFRVSKSNFKYMYWSMCQQLAHHTVNGCNMSSGDMCASGTISGPTPDSYGSMLEISWRGSKPVDMPDGSQRKFIQDGDTVIMKGYCEKDGVRIGFGECRSKVIPAL